MSSNEDRNALLIPTGEAASAPMSTEDQAALRSDRIDSNESLFIPEPRPQGSMSLAEVSQYLNVSEETVTSGLNHSLVHYESSDRVKWFDPSSVLATKNRIADLRQKADLYRAAEAQKTEDRWAADIRASQRPRGK